MIDIALYRARIGCNAMRTHVHRETGGDTHTSAFIFKHDNPYIVCVWFMYFVTIVYFAAIICGIILAMSTNNNVYGSILYYNYVHVNMDNTNLYLDCIVLTKQFYLIIIFYAIRSMMLNVEIRHHVLYKMFISVSTSKHRMSRLGRLLSGLLMWYSLLNFLLIAIVNPSMLNPGPIQNVSIFYHNTQGLIPWGELGNKHPALHTTKLRELNYTIATENPDIVIYNETWLKPSIADSEIIATDKYKVFRLDRCNYTHPIKDNGGGVLIGIKHNLDIQSKVIPVKCRAEILSIELSDKNGRKSIISTLYRVGNWPVGTSANDNHNRVDQYLRTLRRRRNVQELIIIGDVNLPNVNWELGTSRTSTEQLFIDTYNDLSLNQLITGPTHIKGNTLDLILTDKPDHIHSINCDSFNERYGSDHFPIRLKLKHNVRRKMSSKRTIYNFKRADWDGLNSEFFRTNWNSLLSNRNMDDAWSTFKSKFIEITDRHVPKIKIGDEFQPPWYDSEVHDLGKSKQWFHKRWKRTGKVEHYLKFAESRKQFKKLIERKLEDNFEDVENRNHITKKFWSYVKSKSNCHRIPEAVSFEDRVRSNPKDQCELFNEYFYKQFSNPSTYDIPLDFSRDDLYRIDFSPDVVKKHLIDINPNKAKGPDLIHGKILKNCANSLSHPLSFLFRLSYDTGRLPADWKLANVVPIHKKGSKAEVANYRPISLTSLVMKLYEKIVRDELLHRCHHLIDQRQHGFLARKSCCTQMVDFCDSLALSLNDNIRSDVIYFDFQKAFDTVNHDIILRKLKYQYNIDGSLLRFFVNYLKDRYQRVVINNEQSSTLRVNSGVPQGSILGPTIFILFLNDITAGLSPGTNITMYADDTKIWRRIESPEDHIILQTDIDQLLNWAEANQMIFHPDKCKVLAVSNGNSHVGDHIYKMADRDIDPTALEKDLGIHVNSKLNWNEHCEIIYSRANQRLGLLKRTCDFVMNRSKRRSLYLSQVRSQFEHCSVVWRPSSRTTLDRLESIQKRALKWISNDMYISFTNIYNYYRKCKDLNILPLKFRFDFKDFMTFHSIFYEYSVMKLPSYLKPFSGSRLRRSHFDRLSIVSSITPRTPHNLNTIDSCMGISKSFFYRAHLSWNKLPFALRDIAAPSRFKSELLNYIWNQVSDAIKSEFVNDNDII